MVENKMSFSAVLGVSERKNHESFNEGPSRQRGYLNLIEYVYDAIAALDWAQIAVFYCAASDLSWITQNYFIAFDAAWLDHRKLAQAEKVH